MLEAYSGAWLVLIVLTFAMMVGLYSRVVYTLWFKRNDDNQLTHQQKVSVNVYNPLSSQSSTATATLISIVIVIATL